MGNIEHSVLIAWMAEIRYREKVTNEDFLSHTLVLYGTTTDGFLFFARARSSHLVAVSLGGGFSCVSRS
jgi:hypothetical protein